MSEYFRRSGESEKQLSGTHLNVNVKGEPVKVHDELARDGIRGRDVDLPTPLEAVEKVAVRQVRRALVVLVAALAVGEASLAKAVKGVAAGVSVSVIAGGLVTILRVAVATGNGAASRFFVGCARTTLGKNDEMPAVIAATTVGVARVAKGRRTHALGNVRDTRLPNPLAAESGFFSPLGVLLTN